METTPQKISHLVEKKVAAALTDVKQWAQFLPPLALAEFKSKLLEMTEGLDKNGVENESQLKVMECLAEAEKRLRLVPPAYAGQIQKRLRGMTETVEQTFGECAVLEGSRLLGAVEAMEEFAREYDSGTVKVNTKPHAKVLKSMGLRAGGVQPAATLSSAVKRVRIRGGRVRMERKQVVERDAEKIITTDVNRVTSSGR